MLGNTCWDIKKLRRGALELVLAPGVGGRLIEILIHDKALLFQNPDLLSIQPDLATLDQLPTRAAHFPFPVWGGEKTWVSPESKWPGGAPYPELDSGLYSYVQDTTHSADNGQPCLLRQQFAD